MSKSKWFAGVAALILSSSPAAHAGTLDSPAAPTDPGSAMYTLEAVYNRLATGAEGAASVFAEPAAGPASTGHTLDQVMNQAPSADDTDGADTSEVVAGKKFWGLKGSAWGLQTGSLLNRGAVTLMPGTMPQEIEQGYHNGAGSVAGDADLLQGNIRSGIDIFGVTGSVTVVDTASGDAAAADITAGRKAWVDGCEVTGLLNPAPVSVTGQTNLYAAGDDGDLEKGVASPDLCFTDNSPAGTVTDNRTGLMWLKSANLISSNCAAFDVDGTAGDGLVTWQHALDFVDRMNDGTYENHGYTDWRLPNVREMLSLCDYGRTSPALPASHPFSSMGANVTYWTSSTRAGGTTTGWYVGMRDGFANYVAKTTCYCVWPVRGGQ